MVDQLPSVSIIVIVLNNAKGIGESLKWLTKLDYPEGRYEIIVVDNGSTDGTADVVKTFPVRLVYEPIRGFPSARNTGVKHATGDIIAFTDSDCIGERDWLRYLVAPFSDPDVGETGGFIRPRKANQTIVERFIAEVGFVAGPNTDSNGKIIPFISTANLSLRRNLLNQVGGFDEEFIYCSDVDVSRKIQLWAKKKAVIAPKAIVYHHHIQTLKGLVHLCYRNAYGHIFLATRWQKHEPFRTTLQEELLVYVKEIAAMLVYIAAFMKRLVVATFSKRDHYYVLYPLLWLVSEWGAIRGKAKALWLTRGLKSLPKERAVH